jgi:hypothetical protein
MRFAFPPYGLRATGYSKRIANGIDDTERVEKLFCGVVAKGSIIKRLFSKDCKNENG